MLIGCIVACLCYKQLQKGLRIFFRCCFGSGRDLQQGSQCLHRLVRCHALLHLQIHVKSMSSSWERDSAEEQQESKANLQHFCFCYWHRPRHGPCVAPIFSPTCIQLAAAVHARVARQLQSNMDPGQLLRSMQVNPCTEMKSWTLQQTVMNPKSWQCCHWYIG